MKWYKRITRAGVYMWTANSAGMTVLALVTGIYEVAVAAIACAIMAYWWHITLDS